MSKAVKSRDLEIVVSDDLKLVTAVSLDKAIDLCCSDEEWVKVSLFMEDFLYVYRYYLSPHEFLPRLVSKYPSFFSLYYFP